MKPSHSPEAQRQRQTAAARQEITVGEAALTLSVSERTVLNMIRAKRIQAVKVGKCWFVDSKSVLRLKNASGVPVSEHVSETPLFSENQVSEGQFFQKATSRKIGNLRDLNCYVMAKQLLVLSLNGSRNLQSNLQINSQLEERITFLRLCILESLGAGYHSFGQTKTIEYGKARSAAGSLAALLMACQGSDGCDEHAKKTERLSENGSEGQVDSILHMLQVVQFKLLPALVALHRTTEKRDRK